jgi:hypothetical protein
MNLVAKEFVAARDDESGVLLLSQFTGAARELPEALIVNPYDTDQCARRSTWRSDARPHAARADAAHARAAAGVQRLPVGGARICSTPPDEMRRPRTLRPTRGVTALQSSTRATDPTARPGPGGS